MENNEQKQRNPLGVTGFIISIVMVSLFPIMSFILGDMSHRGGNTNLGTDIIMLLFFVPFAFCMLATKRKPKWPAIAGTIISLAGIVMALLLRFLA